MKTLAIAGQSTSTGAVSNSFAAATSTSSVATTSTSAIQTPYITLSQVPYTGLDLGPVGLALYWGFLVLWCLFMAYQIVILRQHDRLAGHLKAFLYGTDDDEEEEESIETIPAKLPTPAMHAAHTAHIPHDTHMAAAPEGDEIDEFILTQIHRSA